jgi:hypothetical protein
MSDQTVKHDSSLPGFLLILLPAAFVAVFLSVAWPFILGGVLLLTGNSVWQSYQWTKLSQQVNPYFTQMVIEQQGEIASLALSTRANISAPVADRYLQGKAAEIGGVSYQAPGGTVYSFLTVGALENTFAGLDPNPSISQKLAELEYVLVDTEAENVTSLPAVIAEELTEPIETITPIAVPPIVETVEVVESIAVEVVEIELPAPEMTTKNVEVALSQSTEAVANKVSQPSIVEVLIVKETDNSNATGSSNFAQALRNIFNDNVEPVAEEEIELEPTITETISQTDLAKRLDVHPSTLYKRRSDVSFDEWTRNRDPEGATWGYQRDTKEFYRIT